MERTKKIFNHETKQQMQMRIGDALRLFNSSIGIINASKNEVRSLIKSKINHELEKMVPKDSGEISELRTLILDQAVRIEELEKNIISTKVSKAPNKRKS